MQVIKFTSTGETVIVPDRRRELAAEVAPLEGERSGGPEGDILPEDEAPMRRSAQTSTAYGGQPRRLEAQR